MGVQQVWLTIQIVAYNARTIVFGGSEGDSGYLMSIDHVIGKMTRPNLI